jgi:hypothetical protein
VKFNLPDIGDFTDEQLSNTVRTSIETLIDAIRDKGKRVDFACFIMIPDPDRSEYTGCFFGTLPAAIAKDLIIAVADGEKFNPKTQTAH